MAQKISTLRVVGCFTEKLQDLTNTSPALVSARTNFSAHLRAATDAFIAGKGRIRRSSEWGAISGTKVTPRDTTPACISMPVALHQHYTRYAAKAGGHTLSALYNSALMASIQ